MMEKTNFTATLLRKNSLRKACQELSVSDLAKAIQDLEEIKEEKAEAEEARKAVEQERLEAIRKIQEQLAELGLSPEDIEKVGAGKGRVRGSVAPKYRLIDADGTPHEWSGRGRTPKVFQERIDKGAKKEDFLIQE
ncbi:H-NS family nucleoid-associated regulatory protein [Marinobacterium aestuariivivens]|uniref:DNA-binding protein n=1 Tax=Marinobacterium aestuariivivens TaxID=1698799 RepID=A0ABW2A995_9GAMM